MFDLSHIQPRALQCSTNETAHEMNRSMVLELIRLHGPVSRAELARMTGLQKSTVSIIANRLISYGWVREYTARSGIRSDRGGRGRKPTQLSIDDRLAVVSVDIRPRTTSVAAMDLHGRILSQNAFQTPVAPKEAERGLSQAVSAVMAQHPDLVFQGIGVSVPGRIHTGRDWDPRSSLSGKLSLPIYTCSAAEAIVLSERWFGSFRKVQDALVIAIAEGVGVGVLTGGRDLSETNRVAGEFGHVVLEPNGRPCGCGKRGCWETTASNSAVEHFYATKIGRSRERKNAKSYAEILTFAEEGDAGCQRAIAEQYRRIGEGLKLVLPFVPEVILFAGDFAVLWKKFGHIITDLAKKHAMPMKTPRLLSTSDSTVARLRGTTALILQSVYNEGVKSTLRAPRRSLNMLAAAD